MTHWYDQEGSPQYTIIGKNGKKRGTTLRDARVHKFLPSVTEIIKVLNAPALNNWMVQQAYLAMATLPIIEGESEDDRIKRAKKDAGEQALKARDLGSDIHNSLERAFLGKPFKSEHGKHVDGVSDTLTELFGDQNWQAEKSFAHPKGFGGKVDLSAPIAVVDYKTKDFDENNLPKAYENHGMQLAAYREGLGLDGARMFILFVSTKVPGLVHEAEIIETYYSQMFVHLLEVWKMQKDYNSAF